jgi:phage shock protein C
MFCTACGFTMNDEHRYCARCGKPATEGQYQWAAAAAKPGPPRRLERDMFDRKIAGVCSGFARYFGMDPTVMRLIWVILIFTTGLPLIAYPICWLVMSRNDARALPAPGATYQQV